MLRCWWGKRDQTVITLSSSVFFGVDVVRRLTQSSQVLQYMLPVKGSASFDPGAPGHSWRKESQ